MRIGCKMQLTLLHLRGVISRSHIIFRSEAEALMCDPSFCIILPNTLDEGQTEEKKIRWANRGSSSLHSCLILAYSFRRRRRRRRRHADERASVFFGSCARKTRVDGGGLSVENEIPFSALHRFESSDLFYLRERGRVNIAVDHFPFTEWSQLLFWLRCATLLPNHNVSISI